MRLVRSNADRRFSGGSTAPPPHASAISRTCWKGLAHSATRTRTSIAKIRKNSRLSAALRRANLAIRRGVDVKKTIGLEFLNESEQIRFTRLRLDVVLGKQRVANLADRARLGHELPRTRAHRRQTMIYAGLEVQDHDLVGDVTENQVLGGGDHRIDGYGDLGGHRGVPSMK